MKKKKLKKIERNGKGMTALRCVEERVCCRQKSTGRVTDIWENPE